MNEKSFEDLIKASKEALNRLNQGELSLKESLEIYREGLQNLQEAQDLLEKAKLEYSNLEVSKDLV
ncbi:exodeoxyribonuclease VII small subunit [Helicobacter pametensis]|uniref:exodeoxyribonuclease VII small subunit n=1 Tax=Helicobacter pametensis TaxID=95149 RepID=UPI00054E344B|nr:exodeoxyribonuclease VII small subunit [Helicobacter pametensis]